MDSEIRGLLRLYQTTPSDDLAHRIANALTRTQTESSSKLFAVLCWADDENFNTHPVSYTPKDTANSLYQKWVRSITASLAPNDPEILEIKDFFRIKLRSAWIISSQLGIFLKAIDKIIGPYLTENQSQRLDAELIKLIKKSALQNIIFEEQTRNPLSETPKKKYWICWWTHKFLGEYQLSWPSWIIKNVDDIYQCRALCAAVIARNEREAKELIYKSYTKRPEEITFIACEEKDPRWKPDPKAFPMHNWLAWPENL